MSICLWTGLLCVNDKRICCVKDVLKHYLHCVRKEMIDNRLWTILKKQNHFICDNYRKHKNKQKVQSHVCFQKELVWNHVRYFIAHISTLPLAICCQVRFTAASLTFHSPWYDFRCWLGVKRQLSIYLLAKRDIYIYVAASDAFWCIWACVVRQKLVPAARVFHW